MDSEQSPSADRATQEQGAMVIDLCAENNENNYDNLLMRALRSEESTHKADSCSGVDDQQSSDQNNSLLKVVGHSMKLAQSDSAKQRLATDAADPESTENKTDIGPVSKTEQNNIQNEIIAIQFASVQITALKAVQCILSSQKYGEMLLVPKSDLVADSSKALADGTVIRKDENFKTVICSFMKKLIVIAASPSPFRRIIEIDELDRARAMIQKKAIGQQAEGKTNLSKLKGNMQLFFLISISYS